MIGSDIDDVIIMGSGIAGVAGASAAQELGVCPVVPEKARWAAAQYQIENQGELVIWRLRAEEQHSREGLMP